MCEMTMCEILKYMAIVLQFSIIILIGFFLVSSIIEDIRSTRKIKKNPKARTDYPYLPLEMVTKHFGWSYEYEKYHGWNYFIWLVRDDGTKVAANSYKNGSRTKAIEDCKKLEKLLYGAGGS